MKNIFYAILFLIIPTALLSCGSSKNSSGNKEAEKNLKNFPAAQKGYKRFVIIPPVPVAGTDERALSLELLPGKTMDVDCNKYSLDGTLSERTLEGWGFSYYYFQTSGEVMSTKMGCPDNNTTKQFVSAKPLTVPYNSKVPVVVYVPDGYDVQYRTWQAGVPSSAVPK